MFSMCSVQSVKSDMLKMSKSCLTRITFVFFFANFPLDSSTNMSLMKSVSMCVARDAQTVEMISYMNHIHDFFCQFVVGLFFKYVFQDSFFLFSMLGCSWNVEKCYFTHCTLQKSSKVPQICLWWSLFQCVLPEMHKLSKLFLTWITFMFFWPICSLIVLQICLSKLFLSV